MIYDKSVTISLPHQYEEGDKVGMFLERTEIKSLGKRFNGNDNIILWKKDDKLIYKGDNGIWYKDNGKEFVKSDMPKYEYLYQAYEYNLSFESIERIETFEWLISFIKPFEIDFNNIFGLTISNFVNNKTTQIIITPNGDVCLGSLFNLIKKDVILDSKEQIIQYYEQK